MSAEPKCSLSTVCPPDHFAVNIGSGVANVVGPKICFERKMYAIKIILLKLTEGGMKTLILTA